jgi:hypothetical protein
MKNPNIYLSTDCGRNPICSQSHYITVFVMKHNFVKMRPKRGLFEKKRGKRDARIQ